VNQALISKSNIQKFPALMALAKLKEQAILNSFELKYLMIWDNQKVILIC
jgi:hypothetical protein